MFWHKTLPWAIVDAEVKISFAEDPEILNMCLYVEYYALSAVMNSVFLISVFMVPSTSFTPILGKVICMINRDLD